MNEANGVIEQSSSPLRRDATNRSLSATKHHEDDDFDMESGKPEKDRDKSKTSHKIVKINNHALFSGFAYCISSCSMILVNKYVLSSYDFNAGISLMLYQNFISVIIVSILSVLGLISTEPLTWQLIKVWLPVNVIFVGMLITSMFSLHYINVAMVTVLKNVTNVITAVGEMYLFNKHHDNRVWAALFLMIISAVSGGITDLSFNAVGYAWQLLNCFLTASYSLSLRKIMDTAKQVTQSGNLNEFSMVLLNNALSLPLGVILVFVFNEVEYLSKTSRRRYCIKARVRMDSILSPRPLVHKSTIPRLCHPSTHGINVSVIPILILSRLHYVRGLFLFPIKLYHPYVMVVVLAKSINFHFQSHYFKRRAPWI